MTAIPLRRRLPGAFSNLPGRRDPDIDPDDCSPLVRKAIVVPSLFGLAPGGVCPAACVTAGAVRSYRTVSPLPVRAVLLRASGEGAGPAVSSLWHFPWAHTRRMLSGTVCPWSPDFPLRPAFRPWPEQPSSRLTSKAMGCRPADVKARAESSAGRRGRAGPQLVRLVSRRASRAAMRAFRVARVETSTMPSTRWGRKWRWKAATASRVVPSR